MTFDPHPARILRPEAAPGLLTTVAERAALAAEEGAEGCWVVPFDRALARRDPEAFVREVLWRGIRPSAVFVGADFRFGRKARGDVATLRALGRSLGFEVHPVAPVRWGGQVVSSSRVRELLARGDVARAARCLGRAYRLSGVVKRGRGRGNALGFPTANLETSGEVLPAVGVYAAWARSERSRHPAVVNVGRRPTFEPSGAPVVVEAHVIGGTPSLYGRSLTVEFVERLRGERRFPSVEALARQIRRDVAAARRALARRGVRPR